MNDMSAVIVPKSDQINADDMVAGPMTITINEVRIKKSDEQPVDIFFEGSTKAYRPCKSMSRVLVYVWGPDAGQYIGKSLQLYRDEKVRFGKDAVGGIRISHMSDIPPDKLDDGRVVMSLHVTRGQHRPHVVRPLKAAPAPAGNSGNTDGAATWAAGYIKLVNEKNNLPQLNEFANAKAKKLDELSTARPELHRQCIEALDAKRASFAPADDGWEDDGAFEGPADEQTGEAFTDDAEVEETIGQVEDEAPAYTLHVVEVEMLIAAAKDPRGWTSANKAFERIMAGLPDDERERLDKVLGEKKRELSKG